MIVLELLKSAVITVLTTYLSFTGYLATYIEELLTPPEPSQPEVVESVSTNTPSNELTLLSRMYAGAGTISRLLSENEAFQNAAQTIRSQVPIVSVPESEEEIRNEVVDALVNVFCEYTTDTYTRTTTGTGFFVTETGVILTNAHVAQFLLLESVPDAQGTTECVIRTGNPATPEYEAELLFISPSWVFNNADLISVEQPQGTGEYDYALLYVTESRTERALPAMYPSLPLYTDFLSKKLTGSPILTAGYPAEKLVREGPHATLIPKIAEAHIEELYTFKSNYADIFSITASDVGEQGASGGPVFEKGVGTIGLIVTKGDAATEGVGSLRALTLSYIDRTIHEETGYSLTQNARGDLPYRAQVFKEVLAPFLTKLLLDEVN